MSPQNYSGNEYFFPFKFSVSLLISFHVSKIDKHKRCSTRVPIGDRLPNPTTSHVGGSPASPTSAVVQHYAGGKPSPPTSAARSECLDAL